MKLAQTDQSTDQANQTANRSILIASFEKNPTMIFSLEKSGLDYEEMMLVSEENEANPAFNFITLKPAMEHAMKEGQSLIIASDPENERIALAARKSEDGPFVILNSHQLAIILLKIWVESAEAEPFICLKSIFTSDLVDYISIKSGIKCISEIIEPGNLQNHITEVRNSNENLPVCAFNIDQQVVHTGYSYTEIIGLIAHKQAELEKSGLNLFDFLLGIYHEFGFYKEKTITVDINTDAQRSHLLSIMDNLRKNPKSLETTFPLNAVTDYKKGVKYNILTDKVLSFSGSTENVLKIESANNLSVTFAPSKTKMVYYISIKGGVISKDKYAAKNKEMDQEILRVIQMFNRGL